MAWAYLAYAVNDNITVRLGRFRTPFYLYSDYLEVGYAYHWIAPPSDVYSLPADSIDGIDVVYQLPITASDLSMQFYIGSINNQFSQSGVDIQTKIRDQAGLALTWNWDWLTIRASHHEAQKVSFNGLDGLFGNASSFNPSDCPNPPDETLADLPLTDGLQCMSIYTGDDSWAQATDNLSVQDVKFTFNELAAKIEWNNLLLVAEATTLKSESGPIDQQNRTYISAGYSFGPVMLHVTQAKSADDAADLTSGLSSDGLGPLTPIADVFISALDNDVAEGFATTDRTTNTVGIRWDFTPGAAFKFEVSDIDDATDTSGTLTRFVVDMVF